MLREDGPLSTRVIIVRHGQSTYNVQKRVQGHCDDSTLTETGRADALKVGKAIAGLEFDGIYSSPLKRAKETAELIYSQLPGAASAKAALQVTDQLKEINLMPWEGLAFDEIETKFPEGYRTWRDTPHQLCFSIPAEGKGAQGDTQSFYPILALYNQAREFWQTVLPQHPDQTILVVAHSAINRALISTAIGLGPERFNSLYQANCGISILNFAEGWGGAVQLESMTLTGHLDQPLPKVRNGHQGPRLLLVRHGETEWNRQKKFQGQIDVPLNENGKFQGQQAADFLKSIPINRAVSSSMLRPKETAELILQSHPHVILELEDELKEISHGLWEGKLEAEIEAGYPGELQQWQQHPETVQMPEGENLQDVWERAIAAWQRIVASAAADEDPKTVLVVAHDAVNKAILCHVVGWDPQQFWTFKQGNGAVSVIDYPNGPERLPLLQSMNITTHLSGSILDQTAAGAL